MFTMKRLGNIALGMKQYDIAHNAFEKVSYDGYAVKSLVQLIS